MSFGQGNYTKLFSIILIPLILSIGIAPALPSIAAQDSDAEVQCREGQVLVFRTTANDYICVDASTASNWVRYVIAELVENT